MAGDVLKVEPHGCVRCEGAGPTVPSPLVGRDRERGGDETPSARFGSFSDSQTT
jgi:hypothetical protein